MKIKQTKIEDCIIHTISLPAKKWKKIDKNKKFTSRSKFLIKILGKVHFKKKKGSELEWLT